MRSKVVVPLLALALVILGGLLLFQRMGKGEANTSDTLDSEALMGQGSSEPAAANPQTSQAQAKELAQSSVKPAPRAQAGFAAATESSNNSYVDTRVEQLQELALTSDASSLETILSELNNPEGAIRKAAIEAAAQFGSRDAIPKLTEAAAQTDDAKDKVALTEAIDFLKLPSLTEVLAKAKSR